MALETASWISQLVDTNPVAGDPVGEGDDHLRMLKTVLQNSFPSSSTSAVIPDMTSQSGKFLTTDGTDSSWGTVPDPIESGTKMMFVQTTAPTGWTKDTTHNNKALRVVSGTASSGGSVAFTTAFASKSVSGSVGSTSLSTAQLASHNHTSYYGLRVSSPPYTIQILTPNVNAKYHQATATSSTGSGNSHNHSFSGTAIDMEVQYVDTIIATKD